MRAAFFVLAAVVVMACSSRERSCYPGDYASCSCDGVRGYARCDATGTSYGTCDCSGKIPGLPSASVADAATEGAIRTGFLEPCSVNDECETGLCFAFNAKGNRCTSPCQNDSDCRAPSPGCSNNHVCKAP